jgi:hypothetical protein
MFYRFKGSNSGDEMEMIFDTPLEADSSGSSIPFSMSRVDR